MRQADYIDCLELHNIFQPESEVQFSFTQKGGRIVVFLEVPPIPGSEQTRGGIGITSRSSPNIGSYVLPGLQSRLQLERGKVGMLGNGMSSLALEIAKEYEDGTLQEVPVLIDLFDYVALHSDLRRLHLTFNKLGLCFPLYSALNTVRDIATSINEEKLKLVKYCVGSGNPPPEAGDCNLLINSHGPPLSSLDEQVSFLVPGGDLYANLQFYHNDPIPVTCDLFTVVDNTPPTNLERFKSYIITRTC